MSSDPGGQSTVISVQNIGKAYTISHREADDRNLRDILSDGLSSLGKRLLGRPGPPRGSVERFWALRDVSFDVKEGECLGIVGGNGAGKSTLLKILSRITEPSAGRVRMRGRAASLLEVGTGFHPELTGRENIYLNGAILGMSRSEIRNRFDDIVAFSEIEKFLDTPVKRYSSGMYVRLAFAVAAHLEPEILIVDEVLAVGDSQFQAKCLAKMKSVVSSGRTVLFVSHNMGAVANLCSRAVLLKGGSIRAMGETGQVVEAYLALQGDGVPPGGTWSGAGAETGGPFQPEGVELLSQGRATTVLEMGGPLQITLRYRMNEPTRYLRLGFHIRDGVGNLICVLSPNQQRPDFADELKGCGTISCTVPSLSLIADTYHIDLHYDVQGGSGPHRITNVASFDVRERDVYGTGVSPSRMHGLTYFLAEWDF